jgi:hypothetical protein
LEVAAALVANRAVEGDQLMEVFLDLPLKKHARFLEQPLRFIRVE